MSPVSSVLECIHADLQIVNFPPEISLDDLTSISYQSNEAGLGEHGTGCPRKARFTSFLTAVSDWWNSLNNSGGT